MPPKSRRNAQVRRSQTPQAHIVLIEEQLSRDDEGNLVPQVLKKLELHYKENKETLNISLLHMILRLCGLSDVIPSLTDLTSNQSIEGFLEEVAQNKVNRTTTGVKAPLLVTQKDVFYPEFTSRLSLLFTKMLGDDCEFMNDERQTKFLNNMRSWLHILSKSRLRNIRFAAVEVARIFIESEISLYTHYIQEKQSRKSFAFAKDVELYLKTLIKPRLKDVDIKIRDSVYGVLKEALLTMETDLADETTIEEVFLPLLQESNPKVVQSTLLTLTSLIKQSKKLRKILMSFVKRFHKQFEKISVVPSKSGCLSLKILIEISKLQGSKELLNPKHISNIFEFYSIENYSYGLAIAIQAFYHSINPSADLNLLYQNSSLVLIEIVSLINNYDSKTIKENIVAQFFASQHADCKAIFSIQQLFQVIISGEYNYENQQVVLSDKEILGWIDITAQFARFIHKKIDRYETFEDQKTRPQLEIWRNLAKQFNSTLLGNIKQIYHQKIEGRPSFLTQSYLQLIGLLFLPLESQHEHSIEYLIEKMVALFQTQTGPSILKRVVEIFFNLKTHNISALILHMVEPNRMTEETIILKKIAILNKYPVTEYVRKELVEEIIFSFRKGSLHVKIEYVLGLFLIHQWYLHEIMQNSFEEHRFFHYRQIQKEVLNFLLRIISSEQNSEVKFSAVRVLCQMLEVLCNDSLSDVSSIYFDVPEEEILTIYRFLDHQYGLPRIETIDKDVSTSRLFNSLDTMSFTVEKGLKMLFNLFENSMKIACFPASVELVLGTLMEEEQSFDPDMTVLKLNKSYEENKANPFNICAREKLATKYFEKLTDRQIEVQNANRFVFWKFISLFIQHKAPEELKEKLVNRIIQIYLRRRMNKEQQKVSLNKALLFLMYQFDRIKDSASYHQLPLIQLILKKIYNKINKQALRRVYVFFKSKYEEVDSLSEDGKKKVTALVTYMQKLCKQDKHESEDDDQGEKQNEPHDEDQINQRSMMRPVPSERETRSRTKRRSR